MNTLRLEELESRHLPSGGFLSPDRSSPQPMTMARGVNPPLAQFAERSPESDLGQTRLPPWRASLQDAAVQPFDPENSIDRAGMLNWGGPLQGVAQQPFVSEEIILVVVVDITPSPERDPSASGPDYPTAPPILTSTPPTLPSGPAKPIADTGSIVAAAATSRNTEPTRTTPSTFAPVAVATAVAPVLDLQGPIAAQLPAHPVRTGEGVIVPGQAALFQLPRPGGVATPVVAEDDEWDVTPPDAPIAAQTMLSALPALDLSALGRDLQQFVGQLEQAGERLIGNGQGLRPWLVAAAAAATACEIGRRQWSRGQKSGQNARPTIKLSDL